MRGLVCLDDLCGGLHELEQDTAGALRVHEGDVEAGSPFADAADHLYSVA